MGSTDAVTNSSGAIIVKESFAAFGSRRGSNWQGQPSSADMAAIGDATRRGYTDHSLLDNVGLVHMNGRVMDPVLGRFLSADPYIDGELDTQGWNRYAYVQNNPLTLADPSGFESGPGYCIEFASGRDCIYTPDLYSPQPLVDSNRGLVVDNLGRVNTNIGGGPLAPRISPLDVGTGRFKVGGICTASTPVYYKENCAGTTAQCGTESFWRDWLIGRIASSVAGDPFAILNDGVNPISNEWLTPDQQNVAAGTAFATLATGGIAKAGLSAASSVPQLTGQMHHGISRPITKALAQHPNLKGLYTARDGRFVTQATDRAAHNGYDSFHRNLDAEVVGWIRGNPNATVQQFENYLRDLYKRPDVATRFPNGL